MAGYRHRRFAHSSAGEVSLSDLISDLTAGDDDLAERAAREIANLGDDALPALFDLLDADAPDARWWGLRTLALIPHPEVPLHLQAALHDPAPDVRQCAALGLSKQPSVDAIPDLIAALESDDRLLARLAADALIAVGSPALPALIAALERGAPSAQREAARALAQIGDPDAIPALYRAWNDGSAMVRYWAEAGLDKMGVGMVFFKAGGE